MPERLLILHGWGSNSERWQKVKELLEKEGIEVLIFDLPGFGKIFSPPNPWTRDDYIGWVFQKIKEKNWEKFNLLGHSFGGGLAVKIVANFSEKIEKLILLSPAIIQRKSIKTHLFYWIAFLGKKIFSLPRLKIFFPLAQKLIYKLADARDYYLADSTMKETMKIIAKENLEIFLEKIKTPTLIIWGEKDDVLPLEDAYKLKERIKGAKLKIVPKAKHSPYLEAPEKLAEIISQFINSLAT